MMGYAIKGEAQQFACAIFVWGIWGAMVILALAFVWIFGSNVPFHDGWDMVPTLTGQQPVTFTWLWSQHNEHRVPLPRLILLALGKLSNYDFRAGMYFGVVAMGALAFLMVRIAQKVHGQLSYTDAFFPLVLLNYGHAANFLWGWEVQYFISIALAGFVLLIIVQLSEGFNLRNYLLIGFFLLLLPLCGGNGLSWLPALSLWLSYQGILQFRSVNRYAKRIGLVTLGLAFLSFLMVVVYFIGYEKPPYHPNYRGLKSTLVTATEYLSLSIGPVSTQLWPFSGAMVLILIFLGVGVLLMTIWDHVHERPRATGLLMYLAAMGSLALATGIGRNQVELRYVTVAVPTLCCLYFILGLYGSAKARVIARTALFLLACGTLFFNTQKGLSYAGEVRKHVGSFERDMTLGVPMYLLINRYGGGYLHIHHDLLHDYMPMLRRAEIGAFRFLKENPSFQEVPVPLVPIASKNISWKNGTAHLTGMPAFMVLALNKARYVVGLRIKYVRLNPDHELPYFGIYWKSEDQKTFTRERFYKYSPTGDRGNWERGTWLRVNDSETQLTVWICDKIDQIRVEPDLKPGLFKISELVMVLEDDV